MTSARLDQAGAWRARSATIVALVGVAGCVGWTALVARHDRVGSLSVVLGIAAIVAGTAVVTIRGKNDVSASFLVVILAAAFLGPASAFVVAVLAEVSSCRVIPTRPRAFIINLFAIGLPALLAGTIVRQVGADQHSAAFYLLLAGLAAGALELNWRIVAPLWIAAYRDRQSFERDHVRAYALTIVINVALAVAGAAVYVELGLAGIAFALVAIFGFGYMSRLVSTAQERARQHAALSWGVLGGLLRALDLRDPRAARHAAAVAAFARDIAHSVGMDKDECELAHTAGLLHDLGHFAVSDRVAERGRPLSDEDWEAIHRHPELGADMLRDLGLYGPVADIVRAHHERVDGRGYPRGLPAEEIPELAKIIAIAEVYDTLTGKDTYRSRMSSFEALRELRRVKDSQLDGRYVEALATLLVGRSVDYRHADDADFDTELDIERRIHDAAAS